MRGHILFVVLALAQAGCPKPDPVGSVPGEGLLCRPGTPGERAAGYLEPPPDGARIRDPVSGETCSKTALTPAAVYEMRTHYFCSAACPRMFADHPERYASP
jgi:YHS domain-containing protein